MSTADLARAEDLKGGVWFEEGSSVDLKNLIVEDHYEKVSVQLFSSASS